MDRKKQRKTTKTKKPAASDPWKSEELRHITGFGVHLFSSYLDESQLP